MSIYSLDLLRNGAKYRLLALRQYANRWNTDGKHSTQIDWRDARKHGASRINTDAHAPNYTRFKFSMPTSIAEGFRYVDDAKTRWYCDADGDETLNGRVWQIAGKDHTPRYFAGYVNELSQYATISRTIYDEHDDALRAADSMAESAAESEREYDIEWREAVDLRDSADELRAEMCEARQQAAKIADMYRAQSQVGGLAPKVCDYLREQFDTARDTFNEKLSEFIEAQATFQSHARAGDV